MKLKCVHLSMKSKCVPWWMTSLWKLKNAFSRGAGVGSVRGAGDAHFKFTVFEVRCSWGCAWWACGVRSGESVPRECAARRARGYRETQMQRRRTVWCAASHRASLARRPQRTLSSHFVSTRMQLLSCLCVRLACDSAGEGRPNHRRSKTTRNSQNAGAGVVGLAHACPALSFCHRITQRALQPQHGVLWLCIVPAASSRTAASFSSRSARRDETWSSVELIVS